MREAARVGTTRTARVVTREPQPPRGLGGGFVAYVQIWLSRLLEEAAVEVEGGREVLLAINVP